MVYNVKDSIKKKFKALLAEIPWSDCECTYSAGDELKPAFEGLISESEIDRKNAVTILSDELEHQKSVYDLSAYAIKPLCLLLDDSQYPERLGITQLLLAVANGKGGFTAHQSLSTFRDMHGEEKIAQEVAKEAIFLKKIRDDLTANKELFKSLLKDKNAKIRSTSENILKTIRG